MAEKDFHSLTKQELSEFKKVRVIEGRTFYFIKFDVEYDLWIHCYTYHNCKPFYIGAVFFEGIEDDWLIMQMFNYEIKAYCC